MPDVTAPIEPALPPADPVLDALAAEVAAAGTRARRSRRAAPAPAFATALRDRLLDESVAPAAVGNLALAAAPVTAAPEADSLAAPELAA
ncbi:MAG: DNA polymerase III subunit gamma and tau, partial [Candidatus Limnocylindrales bacterium]